MVPIPGTNRAVLVTPEGNKYKLQGATKSYVKLYSVITTDHWEEFDDLLMLASYIRHFLNTNGDHDGDPDNPD